MHHCQRADQRDYLRAKAKVRRFEARQNRNKPTID